MFFKMLISSLKPALKLIRLLLKVLLIYLGSFFCGVLWRSDDEMRPSVTQGGFQTWFRGVSVILATCSRARTDYSTYANMAGAKRRETKRHNNIWAGQVDPLRPWVSPRLKPKEERERERELERGGKSSRPGSSVRKCPSAAHVGGRPKQTS